MNSHRSCAQRGGGGAGRRGEERARGAPAASQNVGPPPGFLFFFSFPAHIYVPCDASMAALTDARVASAPRLRVTVRSGRGGREVVSAPAAPLVGLPIAAQRRPPRAHARPFLSHAPVLTKSCMVVGCAVGSLAPLLDFVVERLWRE